MMRYGSRGAGRGALLVASAACLGAPAQLRAQAAAPAPPVYSDSQANRGQLWFESACVACHPTRDMSSPDFQVKWKGMSALDLFSRISNTMPLTDPGSLSRRTYVDIVAYLLRINGLPAGTTALAADSAALRQAPLSFGSPPSTQAHPNP
jgi:mono/diheme cytochrome c family protein